MVDTNPVPLTSTPAHAPRLMRWASIASMSVATVLIAAKTGAWLITDSVSMLSSLIDSSLDLVSSLITFIAIRTALTPADADHRFGHGKAEALAGVAQAGFIAASAGGLLLTVADRFLHPRPVQQEMVGAVVSAHRDRADLRPDAVPGPCRAAHRVAGRSPPTARITPPTSSPTSRSASASGCRAGSPSR